MVMKNIRRGLNWYSRIRIHTQMDVPPGEKEEPQEEARGKMQDARGWIEANYRSCTYIHTSRTTSAFPLPPPEVSPRMSTPMSPASRGVRPARSARLVMSRSEESCGWQGKARQGEVICMFSISLVGYLAGCVGRGLAAVVQVAEKGRKRKENDRQRAEPRRAS
jgi:hypothetical protein